MTTSRRPVLRDRLQVGCAIAAGAFSIALLASNPVVADSKDGIFPTADEVGGEVFPKGVEAGDQFPTDWEIYDADGNQTEVSRLIEGKRTVLAFFISAVPVSVEELKKLQNAFSGKNDDTQLLFVNSDQVGGKLSGVDPIQETARTVRVIKREENIKHPMFVAPNDALSPNGLSNKLGFRGLPTVFVIDKNGTVEKVYVGPQNWSETKV